MPQTKTLAVRFTLDDWDRIERATAALAEREGLGLKPFQVVRGAALKRASQILAQEAVANYRRPSPTTSSR